jgi:ABC-type protease/lipase transport system fused ATPase/permease subunit
MARREALGQLMGGYLHQDWDVYGGDVSDAVAAFLRDAPSRIAETADEIDELIATDMPSGELERRLEAWGCAYHAGDTDDDYRRWLMEIRDQLRTFLATSAAS